MKTKKAKKPLSDFDTLPNAAGVSVEVVAALFDCSNSTVWNRTKRGDLRRGDLFELLVREGWLYRTSDDRWRATAQALTDGVALMRGPSSIAWPQLTPDGPG
ncbi:hypothetical protein [Paraburkholderia sp. 35.1]|uniref:hypothetical protein n=1 Tax=unclassified Paraburkholderia TaxID=2615204 RepID=UPI003D258D70